MVEIRVAVDDAATVHGLVRRLAGLFDGPAVSFDPARSEVRVRSEWESRSVAHVIQLVQAWLAASGVESTTLWIGDRSYTMRDATSPATPDGPVAA